MERIEDGSFPRCTSLETVIFPSTVKTIGTYLFDGCAKLLHIELIEGFEWFEAGSFRGCTSLEKVIFPSTVKTIGKCLFDGCAKLLHIELNQCFIKI